MQETRVLKGNLTIKDRKSVTIDGVVNIEGFDDTYISLATDLGRTVIEGKELRVESLSKENGIIHISGHINAVFYTEPKKAQSIFNKLFR